MAALDKSLDEIINEKKAQAERRGGSGAGQAGGNRDRDRGERRDDIGAQRRQPAPRPVNSPYSRVQHDEPARPARAPSSTQEAKVLVEGLDPAWEARDVREIFIEQGHQISRIFMHWDRSGRSEGSCELTVDSFAQAKALVSDMDGAEVDGFPLRISVMRGTQQAQQGAAPARNGAAAPSFGRGGGRDTGRDVGRDAGRNPFGGRDTLDRNPLRDSARDAPVEGKGGKGGRDRGGITKEELDAELDRMRR